MGNYAGIDYGSVDSTIIGGIMAMGMGFIIFNLMVSIFLMYCQYLLAKKMNVENAWMAFVPILLDAYLMFKMAGKPGWWLIWLFVPVVNIIVAIMTIHALSKRTGYDIGMTLGLIFLGIIFFPYLAFTYKEGQPVPQTEQPPAPQE